MADGHFDGLIYQRRMGQQKCNFASTMCITTTPGCKIQSIPLTETITVVPAKVAVGSLRSHRREAGLDKPQQFRSVPAVCVTGARIAMAAVAL